MPEHDEFDERLAQRLRAYESRIPDGEVPITHASRTRSRVPTAAIGAVTAFGILAGALLALVLLNRPAAPVGESSPTPTVSGEVQPSPSPSASASAASSASPPAASEPAAGGGAIVLGDQGTALVAAGGQSGAVILGFDNAGPAAWHSSDGRAWQPATVPGDGAELRPMRVVASELGYVAAMAFCVTECSGGELWYSADGTSWADTPLSLTGGVLVHLAAGGPGFVAMAIEPYVAGSPGVIPTVLVSADGQTWEASQPSELDGANVHALAAMDDVVVAIGTQGVEAGSLDASWTTSDGLAWERHEEDTDRAAVFDMAWDGTELLAVGQGSCPGVGLGPQCPGEANQAWRSPDGRTWQAALADPCCAGLSSVAATPTGWVVVVTPSEPGTDAPPALAGRVGEAEWRIVEIVASGELILESVAVHDGLVLFVGVVRQGDLPQPVVIVFDEPLP